MRLPIIAPVAGIFCLFAVQVTAQAWGLGSSSSSRATSNVGRLLEGLEHLDSAPEWSEGMSQKAFAKALRKQEKVQERAGRTVQAAFNGFRQAGVIDVHDYAELSQARDEINLAKWHFLQGGQKFRMSDHGDDWEQVMAASDDSVRAIEALARARNVLDEIAAKRDLLARFSENDSGRFSQNELATIRAVHDKLDSLLDGMETDYAGAFEDQVRLNDAIQGL
ncbi:uncharacterized protein PFL1_00365 [Pseudozyma flocculosa PF-1]|uniref:Uncharacterized protein n=1 Tax=Pseudozyma flocculosa TaxID=84751 RepID=A0A5C3ES38_9BASI|nr:uncharacterized protein PFL1_00365 [Pseudozyma flocculosa PF-1]EPQ32168.1 hypothetical protein PFL1_00365 [Pseudozyma flocculosa PF-1]SPO34892.1 uncharacterized protein PSFLO_00363 [Pseudozyma flocculosa]